MIRALHLLDLPRISLSGIRKLPNQARPHKRLGLDKLALLDLLPMKYWVGMGKQRQTWIQTRALKVQGLVSAKCAGGNSVWEIDYLLLSPELMQEEMDLLYGLTLGAGRCGVDKLFLRLAADSLCLDPIRDAGFCFYKKEYLYRLEKGEARTSHKAAGSGQLFHPVSSENEFGMFQLYNSVFPLHVREAEGQTLDEWRAAREERWRGPKAKEYIFLEEGSVVGWVSVGRRKKNGYFSLMLRPWSAVQPDALLDSVEGLLPRQSTLWCIASEFQTPFLQALEDRGYQMVQEYTKAVRNITAKVRRPSLVPIGAE
ncbi:MAG: hypothetical protein IIC81_00485 [Chloroflexi bacterium]|nr:hypothetical protein [Chloroflexota bacterium]